MAKNKLNPYYHNCSNINNQEVVFVGVCEFNQDAVKYIEERQTFVGIKVSELIGMASLVSVAKQVVLSRDTKDNHYLSLCKEVGADILITGDKDLQDIPHGALKKQGIRTRIVSPRESLEEI
jgi:predicted nucleic acid-binding protein